MSQEVDKPEALGWRKFDPITVGLGVGSAVTGTGALGAEGYVFYELNRAVAYADNIVPINQDDLANAHKIIDSFSDDTVQQAHEAIQRGDESITIYVNTQALIDADAVLQQEIDHNAVVQAHDDSAGVIPAALTGLGLAVPSALLLVAAVRRFESRHKRRKS